MYNDDLNDEQFMKYLTELDTIDNDMKLEIPDQNKRTENIDNLVETAQKIKEDIQKNVHIPQWLIAKCFNFEMVKGHLILTDLNRDYWNAVRLYALLLFKYTKEKTKRMVVGINYMQKGLGIRKESVHTALSILNKGLLIKTRREGQKTHDIKHYITMVKAG